MDAAWGGVNCGDTATSAPIFSYGYGSSLSNCPVGTATEGDQYELDIAYDYVWTLEWYVLIWDESTNSYFMNPVYLSSATGTYTSGGAFGVVMEG